jgi:hypothetical protein
MHTGIRAGLGASHPQGRVMRRTAILRLMAERQCDSPCLLSIAEELRP